MSLRRAYSTAAEWRTVIGLEIHAQIKTGRKLFSPAPLAAAEPNTQIAPLDAAFPGTLPVLDKNAIRLGISTALALNCEINPRSTFDRKHYFYHDIPASYQITQHYNPLASDGFLDLPAGRVRIKQLQIEQDTAKSQSVGEDTLVDLNRAGTGLMEIVTEPDMASADEAGVFVRRLQGLLRRVGSGDGDMEKGNLRIDANVSVHRPGTPLGTRCEIKNLNSVRFLQAAIASEVRRHIAHYSSSSEPLLQETRGVDETTGETFSLRSKEEATDYRYMPDANLPAVVVPDEVVRRMREQLPEMPWETIQRLEGYGVREKDAATVLALDDVDGRGVAYFERVAQAGNAAKVANWLVHEVLGQLKKTGKEWHEDVVPADVLAGIIARVEEGSITGTAGKSVVRHLVDGGKGSLDEILATLGTSGDLDAWCAQAIERLPKEAEIVRKGNAKVVMRIVGEVMKLSGGAADARKAKETIIKMINA